jgi:hypothetical protein
MVAHAARWKRSACKVLIGKLEGKRPVGISRYRWEDNIKWVFKKEEGRI